MKLHRASVEALKTSSFYTSCPIDDRVLLLTSQPDANIECLVTLRCGGKRSPEVPMF